MRFTLLTCSILIFLLVIGVTDTLKSNVYSLVPVAERKPIPESANRAKAKERLKNIFGSKFDRPKASEVPSLIKELLKLADETTSEDSAVQYVLLDRTLELCLDSGDFETGLEVVQRLSSNFELSEGKLTQDLIKKGSRKVKTREQATKLSELALELVEKSIAGDDLDVADKVLQDSRTLVRKTKNVQLVDRHGYYKDDVKRLKPAFKAIEKMFNVLKKDPDNSICKVDVGKYLCFNKYDWDRGLMLLSECADEELAELANQDLSLPTTSEDILKIAHSWEDFSKEHKKEKALSEAAKVRAYFWFSQSLDSLSGLDRVEMAKRLEEMEIAAPTMIVLYNQHNGPGNNTGSGRCNITLYSGKKKVWERKSIYLKWVKNQDPQTFVRIPEVKFDRFRVDITHRARGRNAGGLSEVEILSRGINIVRGCLAEASAEHKPNDPRSAQNITDGIKSSARELIGYWLLPRGRRGWADIHLKKWK